MWSRCGKLLQHIKSKEIPSRSGWVFQSCSLSDIPHKKAKLAPLQERRMIDRFRLLAKGGDGGNGCESFRRSQHDRRGKADGGNGGRGGDVILESSAAVWDFSGLQHHVNAKRGGHGSSKNMIGSRGNDKVVLVPIGTVIHLVEGDIPSAVEKSSSAPLNPWEIPGSLCDSHESSQQSPTTYKGGAKKQIKSDGFSKSFVVEEPLPLKEHKYKRGANKPPKSSSSKNKSVLQEEILGSSWEDDNDSSKGLESDDNFSGSMSEEELDEREESQYNIEEPLPLKKRKYRRGRKQLLKSSSSKYKSIVEEPLPLLEHKYRRGSKQPPKSSSSKNKSELQEEILDSSWEDDNDSWEDLESDDDFSGSMSEEDFDEREEIQYNIAELTEPGQQIIIAQGGEGGLGNISLAGMSKKMQKNADFESEVSDDDDNAPRIGLPGSEVLLVLELKSIADVGLVGMPNAGKSTLLGAMSRAKPTVGHYAFTTLRPNLGNVNYDDFSVTVADIPGLIQGAHEDRGLGHAFLRHIERTKVLAYVLDLAAALDGRKGIPPWEQLRDLILELEYYSEGLSDRPSLVVANKIDEAGAEEVYEELKRRVRDVPIFPVCAVLGEGVPELKAGLKMLVNEEESYKINLDAIDLD